jgi:hypothetical protein
MSKHTPGPWEFHERNISYFHYIIETVEKYHHNTFIGEIGGGLQDKSEVRANALLATAAPELLEALQFCKSVIKSQGMFDRSEQMAFEKADAAIKKATGNKEVQP